MRSIWGKDTFVDFDLSLNKVVNRLREALNDEASRPRYIETVPRRGYRFIAEVKVIPPADLPSNVGNLPPRVADTVPAAAWTGVPPQPGPGETYSIHSRLKTRSSIALFVVFVLLLLTAALSTYLLHRPGARRSPPDTQFVTAAANCCARLTRDGKLLAYVSPAGRGPPHIWVQQTAGGDAIQVTKGPDGVIGPDFSPDGTHLAFVCKQGLCTAPTLSGEEKVLLNNPNAAFPVYSPDGKTILYIDLAANRAMTISMQGGEPNTPKLDEDFLVHGPPIWSVDGDRILFYGVRKSQPGRPDGWWVAAQPAGDPTPLPLPEMENVRDDREIAARAVDPQTRWH